MKYVIALVLGIVVGVVLFAGLLYVNPLAQNRTVSPLEVTSTMEFELVYEATPADSIAWIGNEKNSARSRPPMVGALVEAPVENTRIMVTTLNNSRGEAAGLGIKYVTPAEETGILNGDIPVHGAWHIWLLERGGLFIGQREDHWSLLRDVVLPAHLSSGENWRGSWFGVLTSGPGPDDTGRIAGGSGEFAGLGGGAVESWTVRAWGVESGPASVEGRLTVGLEATAATP